MWSVSLRLLVAGLVLAGALLIGGMDSLRAAQPSAAPTPPTMVPTISYIPTPAPTAPPRTPFAGPTPGPLPGLAACAPPIPGFGSRMFTPTGHAATGLFLDFWDANGGLAQQGYPISEVFSEVSDLDGIPYQVQYFERAVFEYHPENVGTPYDILLAQLGTYQYRQKYPTGAPGQRPNGEHPLYFRETGHTLGGEFRAYWEQHGGLVQQGFPISDEFTEISPLDAKPYTVQYFERAVFEFHPENQPPYRVLLSQLGTLRQRASFPGGPALSPTPDPAAARYLGSVWGNRDGRADLAVGEGMIFWFDSDGPGGQATLLGYEVATQRLFTVFRGPDPGPGPPAPHGLLSGVTTDGRTVAWLVGPDASGAGPAIHAYSLRAGRELAPVPYTGELGGYAVDDDTLYYLRGGPNGIEIRAHNWTSGQDTLVDRVEPGTVPSRLTAGNGYVLWAESVASQSVLRIASARDPAAARVIDTGPLGLLDYTIAGDRVIWSQTLASTSPASEVRLYTISTGATRVLVREPGAADSLSVAGDRIAWRRVPSTGIALCLGVAVLDLATGQLRAGAVPSYGGWQMALADPATLAYARAGEPFQIYLQPLR
jgi:hypothetical protein